MNVICKIKLQTNQKTKIYINIYYLIDKYAYIM